MKLPRLMLTCFSALASLVIASSEIEKWCGKVDNPTENITLRIAQGYGEPDGYARSILTVNGRSPGPLITAEQGQTMIVTVVNDLPVQIGMHWHGLHQRGTPQFDGVPGLNQYAIPPGANMTYCFSTMDNYGAYWYHVHLRDIYQDGVRGPILIQPNGSVPTPYHMISDDPADTMAIQAAAKSASMLMVNDWFHDTSEEIAARYKATGDAMRPLCANSILFNGMGQVRCPPLVSGRDSFGCASMMPSSMAENGTSPGMTMASSSMSTNATTTGMNTTASSATSMSSMSMAPMRVRQTDSESGSSQTMTSNSTATINPTCVNTTSKLYTLDFPSNATWMMFHLINAGASQHLAFSIDEHDMWVISADGAFVKPAKVQIIEIAIGQRYGVVIRKPSIPEQAYTMRAATRAEQMYHGIAVLRYASDSNDTRSDAGTTPFIDLTGAPISSAVVALQETRLAPYPNIPMPTSNRYIFLDVKQSQPTENQSGVVVLNPGDVVDVLLQISADSLDPMAHPIHLHGHSFRLLGSSANSTFPADMTVQQVAALQASADMSMMGFGLNTNDTAPYRDTAQLPAGGWMAIRFVADNPGVWLLHCHINAHLTAGMAIAFMELPGMFPAFSEVITTPPMIAPNAPIG